MIRRLTPLVFFFSLFFIAATQLATAQRMLVVDGSTVRCVLPTSTCEITEVEKSEHAPYVGKTITIVTPTYSFDRTWYQMGIGMLPDGKGVAINKFKLKIVTQPDLPATATCKPNAETAAKGFGIDTSQYIRIVGIGPLDANRDQKANFINKVFKTKSMVTTMGDCWFSGMLLKNGRVYLMPCMQIVKATETEYKNDLPL